MVCIIILQQKGSAITSYILPSNWNSDQDFIQEVKSPVQNSKEENKDKKLKFVYSFAWENVTLNICSFVKFPAQQINRTNHHCCSGHHILQTAFRIYYLWV